MSTSRPGYFRTFWQVPQVTHDNDDEAAMRYLTTRWQIVGAAHFERWELAWERVASDAAFAEFQKQRLASGLWAQLQLKEAHRVSLALASENVPHLFLKAIALQEGLPAALLGRCGRDIDLAVPRCSYVQAHRILRSIGYEDAHLSHVASVFRHLSHYEAPTMRRPFDTRRDASEICPISQVADFRLDVHLDATHFLAFDRGSDQGDHPWPDSQFWEIRNGASGLPILSPSGQLMLAMLKMYIEGVNEHGAKIRSYFDVLHLLDYLPDEKVNQVMQQISDIGCSPLLFYVLRRLQPEFGFEGSIVLTRYVAQAEAALARGERTNDFGDMWPRMMEAA